MDCHLPKSTGCGLSYNASASLKDASQAKPAVPPPPPTRVGISHRRVPSQICGTSSNLKANLVQASNRKLVKQAWHNGLQYQKCCVQPKMHQMYIPRRQIAPFLKAESVFVCFLRIAACVSCKKQLYALGRCTTFISEILGKVYAWSTLDRFVAHIDRVSYHYIKQRKHLISSRKTSFRTTCHQNNKSEYWQVWSNRIGFILTVSFATTLMP